MDRLRLLFLASSALAHVTMWPRESKAGAGEKYSVRVPTEGKVAATSIQLEVPEDGHASGVAVPTGWAYELKREADRVIAITWSMEIKPGEFAKFSFLARNPKEATSIAWKVRQNYADGSYSDWVLGPGERRPAPVTKLVSETS